MVASPPMLVTTSGIMRARLSREACLGEDRFQYRFACNEEYPRWVTTRRVRRTPQWLSRQSKSSSFPGRDKIGYEEDVFERCGRRSSPRFRRSRDDRNFSSEECESAAHLQTRYRLC